MLVPASVVPASACFPQRDYPQRFRSHFSGRTFPAALKAGSAAYSTALTMSSTTFLASPNTIIVLSM
jgi:hypothetical protein